MSGLLRGLAIAAVSIGALAMSVPNAEAGKKYRYGSNSGASFAAGIVTGLVVGGLVSNRGYYGRGYSGRYNCYGAYCGRGYYYRRGYLGRQFGLPYRGGIYKRYYGRAPYYRPVPRYGKGYSRAHYNYCFRKYRSYRVRDNTFQPYHGPRKFCRSPYRY